MFPPAALPAATRKAGCGTGHARAIVEANLIGSVNIFEAARINAKLAAHFKGGAA